MNAGHTVAPSRRRSSSGSSSAGIPSAPCAREPWSRAAGGGPDGADGRLAKDVYAPPVVLVAIGGHGLPQGEPVDAGRGVAGRDGRARRGLRRARVAVSLGAGAPAVMGGMHAEARSMPPSIGVGLLGEALVMLVGARAAGVPFAPDKR
ncbi:hypothetical protein [Nonomuraea sp. SYSU D8015]|uniref:hypothetical protein n=1 Tax=Nonomuraea sp. SYSU D8015 TaxID=2593644 RepID=UPI0016611B2A|nr:hypothetical protein [Nonomuraea sp. SYSU D8015]